MHQGGVIEVPAQIFRRSGGSGASVMDADVGAMDVVAMIDVMDACVVVVVIIGQSQISYTHVLSIFYKK